MQCPSPQTSSTTLSRHLGKSSANPAQATLVEIFATAAVDGAATGFALSHLAQSGKHLLWIQDRLTRREAGRPCLAGLPAGLDIIHVDVSKAVDVLWAMEEGLRCAELCGVMGEIWGDPPALDFTATKRLALRAEANNVPAYLMRRAAHANLSAARERWRISSLSSLGHPFDSRAPGQPQWQADLFRARWRTPGQWVAYNEPETGLQLHHPTASQDTAQDTARTAQHA